MNPPSPSPVRPWYLVWLAGFMFTGLAAVLAINIVVDPSGTLGLVNVSGFNAEKTNRFHDGARVERSLRLWLDRYDTIILGTSRVVHGLDPSRPALRPFRAYNAGVGRASLTEVYQVGRFALEHQRATRMIVALDFSMFNSRRGVKGDFGASGFAGTPMPYVYAGSFLDYRSLRASFRTVVDNLMGKKSGQRVNGYLDRSIRIKDRKNPPKAFEKFVVRPEDFRDYDYDPGSIFLLGDILTRFADAGLTTYLFISPVHVRKIESIVAAGLYDTFDQWKRDLAALVDQVNASAVEARLVTLWDFSGYNSITTERVPARDEASELTWYWDKSHYKPATGDMVVARILNLDGDVARPPEDFGVQLSGATVDIALQLMRERRRAYCLNHPDEFGHIARSMERTTAKCGKESRVLDSSRAPIISGPIYFSLT